MYKNYKNPEIYVQKRQEFEELMALEDDEIRKPGVIARQFIKIRHDPLLLSFIIMIFVFFAISYNRDVEAILAITSANFRNYGYSKFFIGFYIFIFAMLSHLFLIKYKLSITDEELRVVRQNAKERLLFGLISPLGVQYLTIHIIVLILMMVSYGLEFGFGEILTAPGYYLELMLTYGINYDQQVPTFMYWLSWILAPLMVIFLGVPLYILVNTGFAPNGPGILVTAPPEPKFQQERIEFKIWAYFSRDVPLADNYIGDNPKSNFFYLIIVFGSIFLGILISTVINSKKFKNRFIQGKSYILLIGGMGFFIGVLMAQMAAPVIIAPSGLIISTFAQRDTNLFIIYEAFGVGSYHPLTIFWIILIQWLPIAIFAILLQRIYYQIITGSLFEKRQHEQFVGRDISKSRTTLTFSKQNHDS